MVSNKLNYTTEDGKSSYTEGTHEILPAGRFTANGPMTVNNTLTQEGHAINPIIWVDVACTATLLDASTGTGKVEVAAATASGSYKVREIILVGGGTSFGAGGNRLLDLTDGTTVYTTIANANLESAPTASIRWGGPKYPLEVGDLPLSASIVPLLTSKSNVATAAGAQLYFQYSGGTPATPHTTGSITFSVCLEKVA